MLGGHQAGDADHDRHWFVDHVQVASFLLLVLLFLVPTALAYFAARRFVVGDWVSKVRRHGLLKATWGPANARVRRAINWLLDRLAERCETHGGFRYDPTATAWDWAVDHGGSGQGFVRVRTPTGWQGGEFRDQSYFSTFPDKPGVFVQQAWQLDDDGVFVAVQPGSKGAWIPCEDASTVEFLNPAADPPDTTP